MNISDYSPESLDRVWDIVESYFTPKSTRMKDSIQANGKDPHGNEFRHDLQTAQLEVDADNEGYYNLRWLWYEDNWVLCGLRRMAFTVGLFYGIDQTGYIGRYCFELEHDAEEVLESLLDIPDDLIIKGNWIKHKGHIEFSNPNKQ